MATQTTYQIITTDMMQVIPNANNLLTGNINQLASRGGICMKCKLPRVRDDYLDRYPANTAKPRQGEDRKWKWVFAKCPKFKVMTLHYMD